MTMPIIYIWFGVILLLWLERGHLNVCFEILFVTVWIKVLSIYQWLVSPSVIQDTDIQHRGKPELHPIITALLSLGALLYFIQVHVFNYKDNPLDGVNVLSTGIPRERLFVVYFYLNFCAMMNLMEKRLSLSALWRLRQPVLYWVISIHR